MTDSFTKEQRIEVDKILRKIIDFADEQINEKKAELVLLEKERSEAIE